MHAETDYKDKFQTHSDTFSIEKVWQEMQELRIKHKKVNDCFNKVNEVLRSPELGEMPERFSTPAESPKKQDLSET
jgi:cytochrome c556